MSRVFLAGLLALPFVAGSAAAQSGCSSCAAAVPAAGYAAPKVPYAAFGGPAYGCVNCVGLFGKIHQHGPLFNYGPYTGYYPFEPYGPWTSDLRYNPPVQDCGAGGCGRPKLFGDRAWGQYASATWGNVKKRLHPNSIKCGTGGCGSTAAPTAGCAGCTAQIDIPMPTAVAVK